MDCILVDRKIYRLTMRSQDRLLPFRLSVGVHMKLVFTPFMTMSFLSLTFLHGACEKSEKDPGRDWTEQAELNSRDELAAGQARERILYTDPSTSQAFVFDMKDRKVVFSYPYQGVARVYSGALGRYGYLIEAENDRVTIIDSGLSVTQEAGRWVEQVERPSALDTKVTGLAPTHFVEHGSRVAIFFDNEGKAKLLDERLFVESSLRIDEVDTSIPHHGVAVPFETYVLASFAQSQTTGGRPVASGVAVYTESGVDTGLRFDGCPGLHGDVHTETSIIFGCRDGLLIVTAEGSGLNARKVPLPSGTPEGMRVGTLTRGRTPTEVLGNFGRDKLTLFDSAVDSWKILDLPFAYALFQYDDFSKLILVIGRDGFFYGIDPLTSTVQAKIDLDLAADDNPPAASEVNMVIGHEAIYLTLPHRGEVVLLERKTLKVRERIQLAGRPTGLALLKSSHSRLGAKVWTQ